MVSAQTHNNKNTALHFSVLLECPDLDLSGSFGFILSLWGFVRKGACVSHVPWGKCTCASYTHTVNSDKMVSPILHAIVMGFRSVASSVSISMLDVHY